MDAGPVASGALVGRVEVLGAAAGCLVLCPAAGRDFRRLALADAMEQVVFLELLSLVARRSAASRFPVLGEQALPLRDAVRQAHQDAKRAELMDALRVLPGEAEPRLQEQRVRLAQVSVVLERLATES